MWIGARNLASGTNIGWGHDHDTAFILKWLTPHSVPSA
jgi:hypothetical protein